MVLASFQCLFQRAGRLEGVAVVVAAGFTKVLSFAFYFCFCFLKARYRKKCKICVVFVACFPLLLSHFIFIPFFLPLSPLPQHLWRNRRKSSLRLPKSPCILGLVAPPLLSLTISLSLPCFSYKQRQVLLFLSSFPCTHWIVGGIFHS